MDSKNNKAYEEVVNYFSGQLVIPNPDFVDISYENWVAKDENLQKLCSPFEVTKNEASCEDETTQEKSDNSKPDNYYSKILNLHDHPCELKLIKWITEDRDHKNKLIKCPKAAKINRHNDILPYTYNTVYISHKEKTLSNYINASYICGPFLEENDNNLFIATQGPLQQTIFSFWKMVLEHNIYLIIMLSNITEKGYVKSEIYWPENSSTPLITKDETSGEEITITLLSSQEMIEKSMVLRRIKINNDKEVLQIHITCWPDHSVPFEGKAYEVVSLTLFQIDEYRKSHVTDQAPIVVHCSAGVGRTGTFIAIYNIIRCLQKLLSIYDPQKNPITPILNVFNVVRKLREQRYSMVSDTCQYKFIYKFCLDWIRKNFNKQ